MARGKLLTEEQKEEVRQRLARGEPNAAIVRAMGVSSSSVSYLNKQQQSNGVDESLKQRLLKAICEEGPFDGVPELMAEVRSGPSDQSFGPHEVTHILYSLNKQNKVSFRRARRGSATEALTHIAATRVAQRENGTQKVAREAGHLHAGHAAEKPQHRSDRTDFRTHGPVAEGGPVVKVRVLEQREPYPLLRALQRAAAQRERDAAKATKYMEAAALLEHVDPSQAAELVEKAATLDRPLTALEREFLAYATAHNEEEEA